MPSPFNVSVEVVPTGFQWQLVVTMTISDPFPPGLECDLASLYEPFVILKVGQRPPAEVPLVRVNSCNWKETWKALVDPSQPLPELLIAFWGRLVGYLNKESEVDTWKVILDLMPTRQIQATAKRETPALANDPKPRIDTSPDYLSPGGDSTPIEEDQMETVRWSDSSLPPRAIGYWFHERHHNEDALYLQATNKSAYESIIASSALADHQ